MKNKNDLYIKFILFSILVIGFLLRINHWFDFLGADEIGKTGLMTWSWDFYKDPFPVHYYPPFFLYLNFLFSFVLNKLVLFLGIIDFGNVFKFTDFGFIFTLKTGRLLAAIFGTLNIYMIYRLGKEFYNKYTGLTAALILSVFWPHVIDSHNFKSDILLTLIITIFMIYTLKFFKTGKTSFLIISSFLLGLAVATKFNGAFFVFLLVIVLFVMREKYGILKGFLFMGAGGIAGFFLGAPNWLVHPVNNVKITLKYLSGLAKELEWYDQVPSSIILYGKNLIEHYGIILIFIFIAGVVLSLIKKDKNGILISLGIVIYFIIAGRENYLNYRAILPLIPLMSLIISKVVFYDIGLLLRGKTVKNIVVALFFIPITIYSFTNLQRSYKSFDLLKGIASHPVKERSGIGEPDYSYYFMKNNLRKSSLIFREMWTPPATGFRGSVFGRDVTRVPERYFSGDKGFNFLITGFRTDYILRKAKNPDVKKEAKRRLKNYVPFYKVDRPAIFTWSDDILFWYRKPDYIRGYLGPDNGAQLPSLYVNGTGNDTVFLPVGRYEKDPCRGKIENGISGKYIFSTKPLKEIVFYYVAKNNLKLIIDVNGSKAVSSPEKGILTGVAKIADPSPDHFGNTAIRRLYEVSIDKEEKDSEFYIYKIEIKANMRNEIPYVFKANFDENPVGEFGTDVYKFVETGDEEIPELFSDKKTPGWIKSFYKKNGIDLILLSYINTNTLFENISDSLSEINSEYYPVERGMYIFELVTEKIVDNIIRGDKGNFIITFISGNNKKVVVKPITEGKRFYRFECDSDIGFFKLKSVGTRENNLLIKKVMIRQDFKSLLTVSR